MKLKHLIDAEPALTRLLATRGLSEVVSLRIVRFWRQAQPEIELCKTLRTKMLQEMGTPIEGMPGQFSVPADFAKREAALYDEEVEIKAKRPFALIDLKAADLSPDDISHLEQIGLLLIDWEALGEDGELDAPKSEEK